MAYKICEDGAGWQPVSVISTTQNHPLGTEARVIDNSTTSLGMGRAVYVEYKVSTAVAAGLMMVQETIVAGAFTPFRMIAMPTTTGTGVPIYVNLTAVASNASLQYGWALVVGVAPILKTAVKPLFGSTVGLSGTAGRVFISATSADQILGARFAQSSVTTTTSLVNVLINRPIGGAAVTAA